MTKTLPSMRAQRGIERGRVMGCFLRILVLRSRLSPPVNGNIVAVRA